MFNNLKHTKYQSELYFHAGGFNYDNDPRLIGYNSPQEAREIIKRSPDTVFIAHDPQMMLDPSFKGHEKLIWFVHGAYAFSLDISHGQKPLAVVSNYLPKKTHPSWNGLNIVAVPLGVDTKQFAPPTTTPKGEKIVVAIVGRVSPEKLCPSWFDSLQRFNADKTHENRFIFKVYGKAAEHIPFFNLFQSRIREIPNIEYLGEVDKEAIQRVYKESDLLLVPSETETGSFAIVEAQCCGLRVFALNRDGIPYHVTEESSLFETYDEMFAGLAKETKRDNLTKRRKQSKLAKKAHSMNRWIGDMDAIVEKAIGKPKQPKQKNKTATVKIYTSFTKNYDAPREDISVFAPETIYENQAKNAGRLKWLYWENGFDCDFNIWVDGNIYPLNPPADYLALLGDNDLALFKHPWRDCVYDEVAETVRLGFDTQEKGDSARQMYLDGAYPRKNGLAETGVLIRRDTQLMREFCEAVWREIELGSHRDQYYFNPVLHKTPALRVKYLPPSVREHPMFRYRGHQQHFGMKNGILKSH